MPTTPPQSPFKPVVLSLSDLAGPDYIEAVCSAATACSRAGDARRRRLAAERVEFYPASFQRPLRSLLRKVGRQVAPSLASSETGAASEAFRAASSDARAPLAGRGPFRVGQDGRLYFLAKSEHYHSALGHAFPGYTLLERARMLGIPNATHNNTRGHITRSLERELVRLACGITPAERHTLPGIIAQSNGPVLNRVINLATGSVAAEAAIKIALARFYRPMPDSPPPPCHGVTPVLIVLGDHAGGLQANYHGTCLSAQILRGMWPDLTARLSASSVLHIRAVRPNDIADLERAFAEAMQPGLAAAGFFHEFVMMNYGACRLSPAFVTRAYALCRRDGVPAIADEIQTCLWSPDAFLFREYGVVPDIVVAGKGMTGGEYAASRILMQPSFDGLPQFGALVTNGQEEISSLAYLVSLAWMQANAQPIREIGAYYHERLHDLAARFPGIIATIDGLRHMASLCFHDLTTARAFTDALNDAGIDISVQTYKDDCPPGALTKLPLVCTREDVDMLTRAMRTTLQALSRTPRRSS